MSLLTQTLLLGTLATGFGALFCPRLVTPGLFYWAGWSLALLGAQSVGGDLILPVLSERTGELLLPLHIAAAVGFVTGALLYRLHSDALARRAGGPETAPQGPPERLYLAPGLVTVLFGLHALNSLIGMHYRAGQMGGWGALFDVSAVRQSFLQTVYLQETLPPMVRLTTHLALFLSLVPFLLALQDALEGRFRWQRLAVWWLLAAPGGYATGGRAWIIAVPLTYAATWFAVTSLHAAAGVLRRHGAALAAGAAAIIFLFSSIQLARVRDEAVTVFEVRQHAEWHDRVPVVKPILYYFAMPTLAIVEYADFVEARPRTHGALTAPFVAAQLGRFGIGAGNADYLFSLEGRQHAGRGPDPIFAVTHSTAVPRLLGDFGRQLYAPVFGALAAAVQYLFLLFRRAGIIRRLLAVQLLLYGGFWVAQDYMLFTASVILPVLALGALLLADRVLFDSGFTASRGIRLRAAAAHASAGAGGGVPPAAPVAGTAAP
jgi:hypothetical protein